MNRHHSESAVCAPVPVASQLKEHQKEALTFMWRNVIGTIAQAKKKGMIGFMYSRVDFVFKNGIRH